MKNAVLCWLCSLAFIASSVASERQPIHDAVAELDSRSLILQRKSADIPPCVLRGLRRVVKVPFTFVDWNHALPKVAGIARSGDGQFRLLFFTRISPTHTLLCFEDNASIGVTYRAMFFRERDGKCTIRQQHFFGKPVHSIPELIAAIRETEKGGFEK